MAAVTTPTSSAVPPFSLDRESRHDLTSYVGRVRHFFDMVAPSNNFASDAELQRSKDLLAQFKATKALPPGVTDADMWEARKKVSAVFHPDTGEKVPLPFRMSMFMPSNLPVTAGMLLSRTTPMQLLFQFLNQTYNSAFNYANRNATVPVDYAQLGASYAVATTTAVGAAFGLGKVVDRLQSRFTAGGATPSFGVKLLSRGLPWLAVATAGAANALAMRYKEGVDGITVFDESGAAVGKSVVAGRAALFQIALTRVVLPIPILLLPPFVLDAARAAPGLGPLLARSAGARTLFELAVIAAFLQGALPFAVALFPQTGSIAADKLEPEFRNRGTATYTFNKGL